jgi:P-type Mg2+ transporter
MSSVRRPHKTSSPMQISPLLLDCAALESDAVLEKLRTSKEGLSGVEAERRLRQYGPNVVARDERHPRLHLLGKALFNPLVILLLVLAGSSFLTGDYRAGGVMLLMVILGVVLRFVQEARASSAAAKLRAMISIHATVLRDSQAQEIPIDRLVPGDVCSSPPGI